LFKKSATNEQINILKQPKDDYDEVIDELPSQNIAINRVDKLVNVS
jgi:hypothetical protein